MAYISTFGAVENIMKLVFAMASNCWSIVDYWPWQLVCDLENQIWPQNYIICCSDAILKDILMRF